MIEDTNRLLELLLAERVISRAVALRQNWFSKARSRLKQGDPDPESPPGSQFVAQAIDEIKDHLPQIRAGLLVE